MTDPMELDKLEENSDSDDLDSEEEDEEDEEDEEEETGATGGTAGLSLMMKMARLNELKHAVQQNPLDVSAREKLIAELKACEDEEEVKAAREDWNKVTPLPESAWLEWIDDDWKEACTFEEKNEVLTLLKSACKELHSAKLGASYCEKLALALEEQESENWREQVVQTYEATLAEYGEHYVDGNVVWKSYRQFLGQDVAGVRQLFMRQLKVPASTLDDVNAEYWAWEKDAEHLAPAGEIYGQTKDLLSQHPNILKWEKKLALCTEAAQASQIWREYLKADASDSQMLSLLHRATMQCPSSLELWTKLFHLVAAVQPKNAGELCEVGMRYCPCADMWMEGLQVLESMGCKFEKAKEKFDQALTAGFPDMEDYRRIYLGFAGYCARGLKRDPTCIEDCRTFIQTGIDFFASYQDQEALLDLTKMWAYVESDGDQKAALYDKLLELMPQNYLAWQSYAESEREAGRLDKVREVYKRALEAMQDPVYCQPLVKWYQTFERVWGDLDSLRVCNGVHRERLAVLEEKKAEAKRLEREKRERGRAKKKLEQEEKKKAEGDDDGVEGAKEAVSIPKQGKGQVEVKNQGKGKGKDAGGEKSQGKGKQEKESGKGKGGRGSGKGNKRKAEEIEGQEEGTGHQDKKQKKEKKEDDGDEKEEVVRVRKGEELKTAFMWNIAYDMNEEDIKGFLKGCDVVDVRLVRNKRGASQGFAYISMGDERSLLKAYAYDKQQWGKRQVRVQKVDSSKTPKALRDAGQQALTEDTTGGGLSKPEDSEAVSESKEEPAKKPNPYLSSPPPPMSGTGRGRGGGNEFLSRHKRGGFVGAPRSVLRQQLAKKGGKGKGKEDAPESSTSSEAKDQAPAGSNGNAEEGKEGEKKEPALMRSNDYFRSLMKK